MEQLINLISYLPLALVIIGAWNWFKASHEEQALAKWRSDNSLELMRKGLL